ncbi:vesicular mannose-binding lectin [Anaeramoeba flamelloides]|uniref:Vesicular mannose-binding lectin n=1 Tax=Anaeramoeba flamelloides TaxID=1746091 RepID=A0AAV7ZU90_9EUKA|nr:vesicular mannose-binding lectin [Anaeramoeba flamelloides]
MKVFLKLLCICIILYHTTCDDSIAKPFSFNHETQSDFFDKYWSKTGSAIYNQNEGVVLTPNLKSQQGSVWHKMNFLYNQWIMDVVFEVKGGTVGADGLAVWYSKDREKAGNAFGSKNPFTGFGVFLDTYQNAPGYRSPNEKIQVMLGDGTTFYDSSTDGKSNGLKECLIKYRNKGLSKLRIKYLKKKLSVEIDVGLKDNWFSCIEIPEINLTPGYFFGFSAATGGLSDKHAIKSVELKKIDKGFAHLFTSNFHNYVPPKPIVKSIFKDIPNEINFDNNWAEDVKKDTNSIKNTIQKIGQKIITIPRATLKTQTVNRKITTLEEITSLQDADIRNLKNNMNGKFNEFIGLVSKNNVLIDEKITAFTSRVNGLSESLEETKKMAFEVRGNIRGETILLREKIQSQRYFGIGWFLLILEIISVVLYMFWRNKKSEENKYYK